MVLKAAATAHTNARRLDPCPLPLLHPTLPRGPSLPDVHLLLGDIGMENEAFDPALADFSQALAHLQGVVEVSAGAGEAGAAAAAAAVPWGGGEPALADLPLRPSPSQPL